MPKWQVIRSASWAKELLMTFIGATLSIVLTFGTAHFVDEKQKREDGRQTAMMVIHDMENTAELFRNYVSEEERQFNLSQHVLAHANSIDALNDDTVMAFATYITASASDLYNYDNSSEQLFLSSQDSWKTINNPAFIDAVQEFFHMRQQIYTALNTDQFFAKPVTHNEYFSMLMNSSATQTLDTVFWVDYVKTFVPQRKVRVFIDYSFARRRYFNQYADLFMSMANRCKFMMGISDDQLAQYVRNKARIGKPLKNKQLVGTWRVQTADDLYIERSYARDHTFTHHIIQYMSYSCYTGQIALHCYLHGTWDIQGDSLIIYQNSDYSTSFDRSNIHYQPEAEPTIDNLLAVWQQSVDASLGAQSNDSTDQRKSVFASIDDTGNKVELRYDDEVLYLTRITDQ